MRKPLCRRVAIIAPPLSTRTTIAHDPSRRDYWIGGAADAKHGSRAAGKVHSKLLSTRAFRPMTGVSPRRENALQFAGGKRVTAPAWPISTGVAFRARASHWLGQVSCLHAADPPRMQSLPFPRERSITGPVAG